MIAATSTCRNITTYRYIPGGTQKVEHAYALRWSSNRTVSEATSLDHCSEWKEVKVKVKVAILVIALLT